MRSQLTNPLILLLPLLASTTSVDARHRRSSVNHHHVNIAERHARAHEAYIMHERSLPTIENRMAKRLIGKTMAKRGASASQCRTRTNSSSIIASSSSSTSKTSSVITSSSAAVASTTSSAAWTTTTSTAQSSTWQADYASYTSSTAAAQTSSVTSVGASSGLTPNGIKAGISAGNGLATFAPHIGWWYDWTPNPQGNSGSAVGVSMLWGGGTSGDPVDAIRLAEFWAMGATWLPYVMGFEEPDCSTSGSANMDVGSAAALWNNAIVPHGNAGSVLIGPSMCHQAAESGWYGPWLNQVNRKPDVTNIHVNKNSAAGIYADLDHYYNTYGKPLWITEFACVDDSTGFVPCTDQGEINSFINTAVAIFESDSRVAAYAISQGSGLAANWDLTTDGSTLSTTGWTYLNAIKAYH